MHTVHATAELPRSARSHKQKRSGQSDSVGSLVMSPFGKVGCWVELRSQVLYSADVAVKQTCSSFVAYIIFSCQAACRLFLSVS